MTQRRPGIQFLSTSTPGEPDDVAQLSRPIALLADGATEPPTELRLFESGFIETTKGTFKCTETSCTSVMDAFQELGRDLPFDYAHASMFATFAPDPAEAGKAAGWFKPLARNGEIWAAGITWTPKAREKILAREFRYISPTFRHNEEGEVLEVYSCALTNDPATKRAKPITTSRGAAAGHTSSPSSGDEEPSMLKLLAARLGLSDTATEAEVFAALSRLQDEGKTFAQIIALSGKPTAAEALGIFTGWQAAAAKTVQLEAQAAESAKAALAREVDDLINEAKRDGRLAPAGEKAAREVALAGVPALKAMLSVLPKVGKASTEPTAPGADGTVTLTAEELEGCKKTGLDPKKYAEHKANSLLARTAA